MSSWEVNDADNPVGGWSSLDDMVWEEFGESDDHIVPGVSGEGWTSGPDRRKRLHKEQPPQAAVKVEPPISGPKSSEAGSSLIRNVKSEFVLEDAEAPEETAVADISLPEAPSEDEEVPSLPEELAAVTISPPAPVDEALLAPGRGLLGDTLALNTEGPKPESDLGDMGVYISGNQIFEEEDPAVVSTSCHFALNDVGPAEGEVEFFEGDDEDGNRGNLLSYGWDSINHADNMFSGGPSPPQDGNGAVSLNAETQQWLATSASQALPGSSPPDGESGMVKVQGEGEIERTKGGDAGGGPGCMLGEKDQTGSLQLQQEAERKKLMEKHQEEQRLLELHHQQQQEEQQMKQGAQTQDEEDSRSQQTDGEGQGLSSTIAIQKPRPQPSSEAEAISVDEDGLSSLGTADTKKTSSAQQTQSTRRPLKKRAGRTASAGRLASPISSPTVSSHSGRHTASMSPGPASPAGSLPLRMASPGPGSHGTFPLPLQRHRQRPYLPTTNFLQPMPHMPLSGGSGLIPLHHGHHGPQLPVRPHHDMQMQQTGLIGQMPGVYPSHPLHQQPQGVQMMQAQMMSPPTPIQHQQQTPQQHLMAGPMQPHVTQQLQAGASGSGPLGFGQGHLLSQLGPQVSQVSSPMTPQEKIEKLKWRQQMRLAAEQRQRLHAQQMAEQQQPMVQPQQQQQQNQMVGVEQQEVPGMLLTPGMVEASRPVGMLSRGAGEGAAGMASQEEGESVEAAVLHQLEATMNKLDIGTRLCIRDALYRLARSSMQRKAASEAVRSSTGEGHQGGPEGDATTSTGLPTSPRLSSILETETNPIDRNIANLLFHRAGSSALLKSSSQHVAAPLLQQQQQQQQPQQPLNGSAARVGPSTVNGAMPGGMIQGAAGQAPGQGQWVWQPGANSGDMWASSMPMASGSGVGMGAAAMGEAMMPGGHTGLVQRLDPQQAPLLVTDGRRQFMPSVGMTLGGGGGLGMAAGRGMGLPGDATGTLMSRTPLRSSRLAPLQVGMVSPTSSSAGLPPPGMMLSGSVGSSTGSRPSYLGSNSGTAPEASQLPGYRLLASRSATSIPPIRPPPPPAHIAGAGQGSSSGVLQGARGLAKTGSTGGQEGSVSEGMELGDGGGAVQSGLTKGGSDSSQHGTAPGSKDEGRGGGKASTFEDGNGMGANGGRREGADPERQPLQPEQEIIAAPIPGSGPGPPPGLALDGQAQAVTGPEIDEQKSEQKGLGKKTRVTTNGRTIARSPKVPSMARLKGGTKGSGVT